MCSFYQLQMTYKFNQQGIPESYTLFHCHDLQDFPACPQLVWYCSLAIFVTVLQHIQNQEENNKYFNIRHTSLLTSYNGQSTVIKKKQVGITQSKLSSVPGHTFQGTLTDFCSVYDAAKPLKIGSKGCMGSCHGRHKGEGVEKC